MHLANLELIQEIFKIEKKEYISWTDYNFHSFLILFNNFYWLVYNRKETYFHVISLADLQTGTALADTKILKQKWNLMTAIWVYWGGDDNDNLCSVERLRVHTSNTWVWIPVSAWCVLKIKKSPGPPLPPKTILSLG